MKNIQAAVVVMGVMVACIAAGIIAASFGSFDGSIKGSGANGGVIEVVAAENFWGSLIDQLGGSHVRVISVVSDPNADPHEYESNASDARAFATAQYVILNGAGYDSWAQKLLSANSESDGVSANNASNTEASQTAAGEAKQRVLVVADLLGKKEGDNPHFWYSPAYVNQVVAQMESDLIALDPEDAPYYRQQYQDLSASLDGYQDRIEGIKVQFAGTKVAATEDIFAYLADAAGLDLVSPPAFTEAVAEGNDPPAASVVEFENQLKEGDIKVLVYNQQTVTPLTDSMKKLAADQGIPVIGVTETIQPPDESFQDWMNAELVSLENALNANALGQ